VAVKYGLIAEYQLLFLPLPEVDYYLYTLECCSLELFRSLLQEPRLPQLPKQG
jgi:hypothetical protein